MNTLIVSDSHGNTQRLLEILAHWQSEIDSVIFLGDGAQDLIECSYCFDQFTYYAVSGNNDWDIPQNRISFPQERYFCLKGMPLYMTHGHATTYQNIEAFMLQRAKQVNAKLALYGHLHIHRYRQTEGIILMNPGSISRPRGNSAPAYALLKIVQDTSVVDFFHAITHEPLLITDLDQA